MSLSKIVVSGRVIKPPEKRFTPNTNMAVTEFTIAVESQARNDAPPQLSPVRVFTWRELAERCAQEIKKGDLVIVDGRLQINNYSTQEGLRRRDVEIEAIAVENIQEAGASTLDDEIALSAHHSHSRSRPETQDKKREDLDAIFASEEEIPF